MEEKRLTWDELTEEQKESAIAQYIAIREHEEQERCSDERAQKEAPLCRGYYISKSGLLTIDI